MKRKTAVILTVVSCVLGGLVLSAFFSAQSYARQLCAIQDVKRLGALVEWYAVDHGAYPPSLKDLKGDVRPEDRKELAELLGHLEEKSNYRPLPTGFTITAHGTACAYESLTNGYNVVVGRQTNHVRTSVKSVFPTSGSSQ